MTAPPQLVMPDSALSETVGELQGAWLGEFGGEPWSWDEAWLWCPRDGFALFERRSRFRRLDGSGGSPSQRDFDYWALLRVWLRPGLRRRGLLTAAWPLWRDRYGDFDVAAPAAAMRAFLISRAE